MQRRTRRVDLEQTVDELAGACRAGEPQRHDLVIPEAVLSEAIETQSSGHECDRRARPSIECAGRRAVRRQVCEVRRQRVLRRRMSHGGAAGRIQSSACRNRGDPNAIIR